jgi:DNA-binding NtrC family response regulator
MIDKVAQTDARVLTGPNGTGKELVAHQLHEKSERANYPLKSIVPIPSELIESELFGHVRSIYVSGKRSCW